MTGAVDDEIHNIINHIVVCQEARSPAKVSPAKHCLVHFTGTTLRRSTTPRLLAAYWILILTFLESIREIYKSITSITSQYTSQCLYNQILWCVLRCYWRYWFKWISLIYSENLNIKIQYATNNPEVIHQVGKILSEGLEIVTRHLTFRHPSHNIVVCQAHPQPYLK